MIRHSLTLALGLLLLAGCASRQPEYIAQDGQRRPRVEAEKSYAELLAPPLGKLDKPLKALHTPFPDYPRDVRNAGIEGSVRTRFTVGEDGRVSNPTVIGSPNPTLAAITLHAIMRWQFEPPMIDGKPTRIVAGHEFVFKLE